MKWLIYILLTLGLLMILGTTNAQEINQDEIRDLRYTREEQKMSLDLYQEFYMLYEHHVFDQIATSEERNMEKVRKLLDVYGLVDPITGIRELRGEFHNATIQQHYDHFYALGIQSRTDALKVSAQVEELDISILQLHLNRTDNPLLRSTYEQLLRESEDHLLTFVRHLEMEGQDYHAKILSEEELQKLLSSDRAAWFAGKKK
jgi:hypothetical protein